MSLDPDRPLHFSRHARDRMLDFGLSVSDVKASLASGEVIEEYEDESRLIFGRSGSRPVHIVVCDVESWTFVITTYVPDPSRWDASLRRRIRP